MKVLMLSTYSSSGGAAVAAKRLADALRKNGIDVEMLCRKNIGWWPKGMKSQSWTSITDRAAIFLRNSMSTENLWAIDTGWVGQDITKTTAFREADVIHLQWTNQGFLSLSTLDKILHSGKRIVITMHDMWYCTSVCHHAYDCTLYATGCHDCRLLKHPSATDFSRSVYDRKRAIMTDADLDIVTVSEWLADKARKSGITGGKRITVIPNTVDLTRFRLLDRHTCRKEKGVDGDALVIAFCAARIDIPIKGFGTLVEALGKLVSRHPDMATHIQLRLIGEIRDRNWFDRIPVNYEYLGTVTDPQEINSELALADVLASASDYETFGQTLVEAMASGTVAVSFGNSGQRDVIRHKENGYLVEEHTAEAFADGLEWTLTEGRNIERNTLHEYVERNFSEETVAEKYVEIYRNI